MYGAGVSRGMRYGQHAKARFKASTSHLEKPGVRILDYPMMGESVRRLLVADGRCMKEELLSIGEFAKLRGVSVKSLRYYERVGALKPAYVNEESGYRYYSINQISDLDMVTTFIELGVPLKEIASTAALGYGQSELIEKGRELARERIGRAEAQLLQLNRYADEIAESQRFQSKKRYEREFAERLLLCAPLAGDFDMRRYARVTSAIYEAAPGMRLVPLYTEGVARGLGEPFLGVSLGEENGLIAYVQVEMLPSYPFDAEAARCAGEGNDACAPSCWAIFVRSRALGRFFRMLSVRIGQDRCREWPRAARRAVGTRFDAPCVCAGSAGVRQLVFACDRGVGDGFSARLFVSTVARYWQVWTAPFTRYRR